MSIDYYDVKRAYDRQRMYKEWDRETFWLNRMHHDYLRERALKDKEWAEKKRADAALRSREAQRSREEALWQQYRKAFKANDFNGALDAADLLLIDDAGNYFLFIMKGMCFVELERYDDALAELDKCWGKARGLEERAEVLFWEGLTAFAQGNFIMAESRFDHVLIYQPNKPRSAYFWRARAREQRGDLKGALADLTQHTKMYPSEGNAFLYRGRLLIKMGDTEQGRRDLQQAIELYTKEADEEGVRLAREALLAPPPAPPLAAPRPEPAPTLPIEQLLSIGESFQDDVDHLDFNRQSGRRRLAREKPPKPSALLRPTSPPVPRLARSILGRAPESPFEEVRNIAELYQVDVNHILQDRSLSVEDKVTHLLYLITKKMDQDIERQAQFINSIRPQSTLGPSIDVETRKLKRLIDARSELFDKLRQLIDKFNQTVK